MDLCFELAAQLMRRLDGRVTVVDEVQGFKYFDERDLMGFVDGTENPVGPSAIAAATIGDEDPDFAGGSYVIVQKYLHDLTTWDRLTVEEQERVIGRTKLSDIELADEVKPANSHVALNTITGDDGEERQIVRDNMPFGRPGHGEFGTYFIGYAGDVGTTEQMLRNMFLGSPPGTYDRILDFSTAVTGSLFFVPSADFLDDPQPVTAGACFRRSGRLPGPRRAGPPTAHSESAASRGAHHEQPASRTRADLRRGLGRHRDRGRPHLPPQPRRAPGGGRDRARRAGSRRHRHRAPRRARRAGRRGAGAAASGRQDRRVARPVRRRRQAVDDVDRGAKDSDWQPVKDAARTIAFAEDRAIFDGFPAADIAGIRASTSNPGLPLPADAADYPDVVAQALTSLRLAGVDGPWALLLSADAYTQVAETTDHGYPIREHITRVLGGGEVIWAPAIEGAFLVSTRGGDYELYLGQDLSIGYQSHDAEHIELYFQESFTFLVQTAEAGVVLSPGA